MKPILRTIAISAMAVVVPRIHCIGQSNLVVNPGFEQYGTANDLNWLFGGDMFKSFSVDGWSQPTRGSSDYFFRQNENAKMNISPYGGDQVPAGGNAFAGFISWVPGREYREYITGELTQPLEKGKKYKFRMKISTGSKCAYLVNELGVHFSDTLFEDKKTQVAVHVKPQVWLDVTPTQTAPESWIEIEP